MYLHQKKFYSGYILKYLSAEFVLKPLWWRCFTSISVMIDCYVSVNWDTLQLHHYLNSLSLPKNTTIAAQGQFLSLTPYTKSTCERQQEANRSV